MENNKICYAGIGSRNITDEWKQELYKFLTNKLMLKIDITDMFDGVTKLWMWNV